VTTTDAAPGRRRPGVSVRVRITATVALLAALALTGAGLIVYVIEDERIEEQISAQVDQNFAEFREFQTRDGAAYATVGQLLRAFLVRQVTDEDEALVIWYDGAPQATSFGGYTGAKATFRDAVAGIVDDNGSTTIDDPRDELFVSAQTVRRGEETGALLVVTYYGDARAGLLNTIQTYAVVSLLALLVITGFAAAQSGRLLRPLRRMRTTAEEIGDSDLSQRLPETGNDDITALTRTFNGMLDRLEAAFTGQRRFLDDAGHELKTPLTVLRGHLELLDVGDPREIAETRDLLLDEVDRMARLVGDLILLAKSDRPDFVTPRPTDLTGLTVDTLAKARGLAERRWVLDETAGAVVLVDEQRLTQALLQLCHNAVTHTTPADTVALGSSYDGTRVRLWVRDTGPGVAPEHREQIFERFGRGDVPTRAHDAPDDGFGLGLSIVRAIAHAHGGEIGLDDEQPHGARFTIDVPARTTRGPGDPAEPAEPSDRVTRRLPTLEETHPWPAS